MPKTISLKEPKKKPAAKKKPLKKTEAKSQKIAKTIVTSPINGNYFYAHGKRKTSVAGVRIFPKGKGTITINHRTFENYFPVSTDQDKILSPFRLTNHLKTFDVSVKVHGGGIHSQAEAIRHGISKALLAYEVGLRTSLKHAGFLTRDSRVKERKKYGLKRARRAPQWQKR